MVRLELRYYLKSSHYANDLEYHDAVDFDALNAL